MFQRELELKVQILERKVESYKKLAESLDSTVDSVRVKESCVSSLITHSEKTLTCLCEQDQAQEAEQQIHLEFQRLHQALLAEERLRLEALAAEEQQKIAALRELGGAIRQDVAGLRRLVESVKREMGNEDVPLLQVGGRLATPPQHHEGSFLTTVSFLFQNFQDLKRK